MAITKYPAEKSDAGSKAAQTRVSLPQADNRREGVVVDETENDDLQASMRTIMAMQLRTDSNMEEVRAEVEEAKRDRDIIMQLLTGMQEEQRRLAAALGLGGGDRCQEAAAKASKAAAGGQHVGAGGGKSTATSAVSSTAAVPAAVDAVAGPGGEATAATLGPAGTDRVGPGADGPQSGPRLLPTPTLRRSRHYVGRRRCRATTMWSKTPVSNQWARAQWRVRWAECSGPKTGSISKAGQSGPW
ncbi:unnamed protein product [Linum trigynum]|uniref:Ty3-gypsy retrotransposon protein n=1 Tax=Linum trigynum TaxID=586398 RepID=A0AAV2G778_9ROSI